MSLAGVTGVTLRELFETDDQDFLLFVSTVTEKVIDARAEMARR